MTGTVAFAVDVAPAELEIDEAEDEADVTEEGARFSNCPGSHVAGAQSSAAWTGMVRQTAMVQRTRHRDQDVPWQDFMAVVE